MSRTKTIGEQLLAREIAQARAYLEGHPLSDQRLAELRERSSAQLIQEAQLLREAVSLRQQREIAEHVRDSIELDKAARKGPRPVIAS